MSGAEPGRLPPSRLRRLWLLGVLWTVFVVVRLGVRTFGQLLSPPVGGFRTVPVRIDVNRAPIGELALLPGIGPRRARQVVLYRVRHGPFADVAELARVDGIGPVTVDTLKPFVQVGSGR